MSHWLQWSLSLGTYQNRYFSNRFWLKLSSPLSPPSSLPFLSKTLVMRNIKETILSTLFSLLVLTFPENKIVIQRSLAWFRVFNLLSFEFGKKESWVASSHWFIWNVDSSSKVCVFLITHLPSFFIGLSLFLIREGSRVSGGWSYSFTHSILPFTLS